MILAAAGIAEISDAEWTAINMVLWGQLIALAGVAFTTLVVALALRWILLRRQFSLASVLGFAFVLTIGIALVSFGKNLEWKGDDLFDTLQNSTAVSN